MRKYVITYTDLSFDQVRNLQHQVLEDVYNRIKSYVDYMCDVEHFPIVKVPSTLYQMIFYNHSPEYLQGSPVDPDHWGYVQFRADE